MPDFLINMFAKSKVQQVKIKKTKIFNIFLRYLLLMKLNIKKILREYVENHSNNDDFMKKIDYAQEKAIENSDYPTETKKIDLNTWTTVSALNLHNFTAIEQFTADNQLKHSFAFLHSPDPLNVRYKNNLTDPYQNMFPGVVAVDRNNQVELDEFIDREKALRGL
jgi:hypothetical protein